LKAVVVVVRLVGGIRSESIICTTPPVNAKSARVRVLLLPWPLTNTTTSPACLTFATLWPPVTLFHSGDVKSVGIKVGVPGTKLLARRVP